MMSVPTTRASTPSFKSSSSISFPSCPAQGRCFVHSVKAVSSSPTVKLYKLPHFGGILLLSLLTHP